MTGTDHVHSEDIELSAEDHTNSQDPLRTTIHEILSVAFPFYFLIEKFNSLLNHLDMWKSTSFYKQNEDIYSSVVYKPLNYNGRAFVASRQFRVIVKAEDQNFFKIFGGI